MSRLASWLGERPAWGRVYGRGLLLRLLALLWIFATALSGPLAHADAANGGLLWTNGAAGRFSACAGCHTLGPGSYQLNAANNSARISTAINPGITNPNGQSAPSMGTFTPTAQELADLAAYIGTFAVTSGNGSGTVGQAFSYQIVSALPSTNSYSASGLPAGVTLNTSTGAVSGTPSAAGSYSVTISASNAVGGNGSKTVTFSIANPPPAAIVAGQAASGTGGVAFSYQIQATNSPTSYSATGLPAGLSLNTATGLISGTPTVNGSFAVTASASNAGGSAGSETVTINIALAITSSGSASGNAGYPFSYQITTGNSGSGTSYSVTGTLPAGLTLNTSTGLISGTPTQTGTFNVTLGVTNSGGSANRALTITIGQIAPTITSASSANGIGGQAFNYQITAHGLPTSYGLTGTLPTGLSVNTNTGLISGTPTQTGTFNVTIQATNGSGTGSQALAITISTVAPVITSGTTASGTGGQPFSYQITASNLPSSYSVTGALPAGVAINSTTGLISGTPTATGTFTVDVVATNASGSGTQTLTITIALAAPAITSASTASGVGGQAFSYQITASNLPASYSVGGSLPPGVILNTATGLISGTPTASGSYSATVSATNGAGTGSQALTITISLATPAITSAGSANGTSGQPFSYQITASNLPASFGATGLPSGVSVDPATGLISGTPSVGGTFNATVSATNGAGTGNQALTINLAFVAPGAAVTNVSVPYNTPATINLPVTGQFTQVNITTAPLHGSVPAPGANTSTVTYTPQAGYTGPDSFAYTATGPGGTSAPATVTITVNTLAPSAGATTLSVQLNTSATLDLAPFIGGSGIVGVTIAAQPAHGTATASGTKVTYTPANNYFGADSFSYATIGNAGTSASAVISVTVSGRPDVAKDPAVVAMAAAQAESAHRFVRAQVSNFHVRMEGLHHRSASAARATGASGASGTSPPAAAFTAGAILPGFGALPGSAHAGASPAIQPGTALNAGAYRPAANLSATMGSTDVPSRALPAEAALPTLVAALSASAAQGGQGANGAAGQTADLGKVLLAAAGALQSGTLTLNYSSGDGDSMLGLPDGVGVWIAGGARFGSRQRGARNGGLSFSTDGISMGIDRRFREDLTLGLGLGFARDQTDIGNDGTNSESKSFTLAAYGSYQPTERTFLDGLLGYGVLDYHTDRFVAPVNDFARSDRSGNFTFASLTGGYEFRTAGMLLSPYGRLDAASHTLDRVTENGAGAYALTYAKQTTPSVQFSLGLRAETAHQTRFGWVLPRLRAEVQHEFKGESPALVSYADLINGPFFALPATAIDRNSVVLGVGSDFLLGRGLTLSFDYQMQRASSQEENQAVFFKMRKDFDGYRTARPAAAFVKGSLWIDTEFAVMFDDNISRTELAADRDSDQIYSLDLSKRFIHPISGNARLVFKVFGGGEKHRRFTGLDRIYAGADATLQYRPEGSFGAPTWGLFANLTGSEFESNLRDGYRYSAGLSVHKPLTDRINLFGAVSRNVRGGRSAVFDNKDVSARLNLDYALQSGTLYATGELRRGDVVSSGRHTLVNIDISEVFTRDDVFTSPQLYSYRFEGRTALVTLGYSLPIGQRDSFDFSWRHVVSTPDVRLSFAPRPQYTVNQFSIVYLTSF